jgi:hypothetical protein
VLTVDAMIPPLLASVLTSVTNQGTPILTDWFEIAPATIALLAALAAALYYFRVVRQNRTTHEFEYLMRSVAVYHEFMSTKRSLAGAFLLERLRDAKRMPKPSERLAVADLMRYFDTISWRAFCVFKFDLGSCEISRICIHRWHPGVQQRHEGIRAVVREIGVPAYIYYQALSRVGQNAGEIVREARLESLTQFKRMVDTVADYIPQVTSADLTRDLDLTSLRRGYYFDFLCRETKARDVRPDALESPRLGHWLFGLPRD